MKKMIVASMLVLSGLLFVGLAPSASAFHGAWWRGFGTAQVGNVVMQIDFVWGGQDSTVTCAGGGCMGVGDGWFHFTSGGVALPPVIFEGVEDVRNIFFTPNVTNHHGQFCTNVEVTPNYSLVSPTIGLVLTGRQEGCMDNFPNRENHSHFAGILGPFFVAVHANGFWMGGAPPVGAFDGWCCHG